MSIYVNLYNDNFIYKKMLDYRYGGNIMEVGKQIKQLREQKGYTLNRLANMAGVSQSYLRDVELENKNPTLSFLSLICDALDISLKDFFNDEAERSIISDPVVQAVYKLTPEQKATLLQFLNTIKSE